MSSRDASHPYVPPGPNDSRAPCPGLNTLANHGYLSHDGRNLTLAQLVSALHNVYGISRPLATIFTVGGLVKCGHWRGARRVLDLHDLARHGVLEHDGSLVHADAPPGQTYASTDVDRAALQQLLDSAEKGPGQEQSQLSLGDLCRGQVARQRVERPLKGTMAFVARGELGLIYDVFGVPSKGEGDVLLEKSSSLDLIPNEGDGGGRVVPKSFLEQWLGEERLPDGWEGPVEGTSLVNLLALAKEIKTLEDPMRGSEMSAVAGSEGVAG